MEQHDIPYFRNLWQMNMSDLENQCQVWEKIIVDNEIPDDVLGDIRTNIGLARLLMNQKLKQFKGLIDDSEFNTGEKEITCTDLEGFWDMVYFEVEKIQKNFKRLDKCKNNQWLYAEESAEKNIQKKITTKKDIANVAKKNELRKAQMLAAKQRLAEVKKKMMSECKERKNQNFVEIRQVDNQEQSEIVCPVNENIPNAAASEEKMATSEPNARENHHLNVSIKAVQSIEVEEPQKIKDVSNQKSAQKKKHSSSAKNKENVFKGSKELKAQDAEKIKRKSKDYGKLQCVTRSAAKAMLLQQNTPQK